MVIRDSQRSVWSGMEAKPHLRAAESQSSAPNSQLVLHQSSSGVVPVLPSAVAGAPDGPRLRPVAAVSAGNWHLVESRHALALGDPDGPRFSLMITQASQKATSSRTPRRPNTNAAMPALRIVSAW